MYFQTAKKPAADTTSYVLVIVLCFDMGSEDFVGYLDVFSDSYGTSYEYNLIFACFCPLF